MNYKLLLDTEAIQASKERMNQLRESLQKRGMNKADVYDKEAAGKKKSRRRKEEPQKVVDFDDVGAIKPQGYLNEEERA